MSTISILSKASARQLAACEALLYGVLQQCSSQVEGRGIALALVSPHPGAGVSHVAGLLEQIVNENAEDSAVALDCASLGYNDAAFKEASERERKESGIARRGALGKLRDRSDHLAFLRKKYKVVILDCHSLDRKTDVLGLAPTLDGILLVIESNKTTKGQLDYLERTIEMAGGKVLGSVLNKRTYPIPGWINKWMERMGI